MRDSTPVIQQGPNNLGATGGARTLNRRARENRTNIHCVRLN
jgi:hypothetical protein